MAQYSEEELVQIAMQQYEENEEFKEKVNNAIKQRYWDYLRKLIAKATKVVLKCVTQAVIDHFVAQIMPMLGL